MPDPISRWLAEQALAGAASWPAAVRDTVAAIGSDGVYVVALLVVGSVVWEARTSLPLAWAVTAIWSLVPLAIAAGLAVAIAHAAGSVVAEQRPFLVLGREPLFQVAPDPSFPSDHVTIGMALLAARRLPRRVATTAFLAVVLVGLARVLAGVHWLDDIVAGALIGGLLALLVGGLWQRLVPLSTLVDEGDAFGPRGPRLLR